MSATTASSDHAGESQMPRGGFVASSGLTPLRITVVYAALGFAFLFLSDVALVRVLSDPLLGQVQAAKGGVEVVLTAGLIFVLTRRRERELQRVTAELEQERSQLEVLYRVLRHNLRNDLSVIRSWADHLSNRLDEKECREECDHIRETVGKMEQYTTQARRIKQLTGNSERTETIDISERIPVVLESNQYVTEDVTVSTSVPEGTTVEAHYMFEEVLSELLTNSIVHNDADEPTVSLHIEPTGGEVAEIRVTDNGPGIPATELEALERGDSDQIYHLSGMGLWFVKWGVELSEGTISFDEADDGGTVVTVRVPTA